MLKKHTKQYYLWSEIQQEVNTLLGKDIRDYTGLFAPPYNQQRQGDLHDFWRWWTNQQCEFHNGTTIETCFDDVLLISKNDHQPKWIIEILQGICTVLGKDAVNVVLVEYSW